MTLRERTRPIRESSLDELSDPSSLELILLRCGIGIPRADNIRLPESWELVPWQGVAMLQMPNQLAEYLIWSSRQNVKSYLEVGLARGLLFATTIEYLNRFGTGVRGYGIDIRVSPELLDYAQGNSVLGLRECRSGDVAWPAVDAVFIDGGHDYEEVKTDYVRALECNARIIAFHDIVDEYCPGVRRFWNETMELGVWSVEMFCDQPSSNHVSNMGIGVLSRLPGKPALSWPVKHSRLVRPGS